jgi:hypothetical protein
VTLRSHTIRLSDRSWDGIGHEARLEGVSANQWIVEAAIARLTYARMRREEQIGRDFDTIFEALRELRDGP